MGTSSGTSGSWAMSKGRLRRLAALALVASATVAVDPLSDAAQAASGDFSVDFTAAAPDSYNHLTGGGAFDDRTVGVGNDIVESLEGGDFACGDVITYLAQVVVDDTQSAGDDAPQTIELDVSFLADTTGQSGVAIGEFVDVTVNYGTIEDLVAGENGIDDGISDDGGSVATLTAESLTGPLFTSGSELLGTVELTDLERNEKVVVRIDVKLFCDPGSNPTGNLQGQLDAGRLTFIDDATPVDPAQALSGGAQTIPFKQIGNIASPAIAVDKTVTTETGACSGVETLTVQAGETVKYCYIVSNTGDAPLYGVVLVDDNGTPGDTGDDFTVTLTGLADVDLDGSDDDLGAGNSASGEALVTLATAGTVVNTATATGDDSIIQPTTLTASDTAEVIIDRTTASLTVDKTWVDASIGDQVEISIGLPIPVTGTSTADTANETDADVVITRVLTGDTVTLDEKFLPSDAAANYDQTLTCAYGQQDTSIPVTNGSITVPAAAADSTITCTFENARKSATLTLEKAWVDGAATDEALLTIDGTNDDSDTAIADGSVGTQVSTQTSSATVFAGEAVVLTEVLGVGNTAEYASELTCGGTPVTPLTDLGGTYTVPSDPRAVTCRFTNTAARGTIVIVKNAEGGAGTFDYTGDWADVLPGGDFQIATTGAGPTTTGSVTYSGVLAGSYAVAETNPQPTWDLASLVCRDSDSTGTASSPNPSAPQLDGVIELDAGETVTCTFNNTKRGSITIVKDVTNTENGLSPNVFDFGGDLGIFTLTDAGTPGDNTTTFGNLVAGDYTVTETDANANGFSLDSIDCGDATTVSTTDGVTITLGVAESVTCTFVNRAEGNLSITKTAAASQPQVVDADSFSVTYDLVVTNNGPGATAYDLADTPDFGTGATITEVAVSSAQLIGSPVIDPANPIVSGEPIPGGGTSHTYTVVIAFDVAPTMTKTARTCDADTAGRATFNSAMITFAGGTASDNDCVTIPDPDIDVEKTATTGPTHNSATDTYSISYDVMVTNSGNGPGTYDLVETPTFGGGTTITKFTVDSIQIPGSPLVDPANPVVDDESISAGATHNYLVTIEFTVDGGTITTARDCTLDPNEDGTGTLNTATVTPNIGPASSDDACGPVPGPDVRVDKTVSSGPFDNLDGTFSIVYAIEVANTDTAGAAQYDLVDVPAFSPGLIIDTQAVANTVPGTIATDTTFPTSGAIVTGQTIVPGATHTYEVTVVATLDVDNTTTYEECSSTTGTAGEGLFNRASLTVDGETTIDDVCEDIAGDLMIEKSDGDIELSIGDGPFEYQLKVTNVGGTSTGSPVIVTDVLPVEFKWVDFPDTAGDLPFCTQAGQVLTCEIDSTLVDAGGESTAFLVAAEARDGIAESIDGYENLSFVDSPGDPAPSSPSCGPQAISSTSSSDVLVAGTATPTNNVACDRTPVLPSGQIPIVPPTTTPPTTTPPPPTVPPGGLPRTGSDGSMNTLSLAALLLGLGVGLTLVVRRRQQQA